MPLVPVYHLKQWHHDLGLGVHYRDCLRVFVSWSWQQVNIHWLYLITCQGSMCSTLFLSSDSTVRVPTRLPLGALLTSHLWRWIGSWETKAEIFKAVQWSCHKAWWGLTLMVLRIAPCTVCWGLMPTAGLWKEPLLSLYAEREHLKSALFSCSIGRGPKLPQICPNVISTP